VEFGSSNVHSTELLSHPRIEHFRAHLFFNLATAEEPMSQSAGTKNSHLTTSPTPTQKYPRTNAYCGFAI
jgi:hypothetical protein